MSRQTVRIAPAKIEAISSYLARSEVGRALLDGLAARHQADDLNQIYRRIERLEAQAETPPGATLAEALAPLAEAIQQTRADMAELRVQFATAPAPHSANDDLAGLADVTDSAVAMLLDAARRLRIIVVGLREAGIDERICTLIDQQVTHLLIATERHELTGVQLHRMAGLLDSLESSVTRLAGATAPTRGARRRYG